MTVFVVLFSRHHFPSSLLNSHSPNSLFMSNGAREARMASKSGASSSRPAVSLRGRELGSRAKLCWLDDAVGALASTSEGTVSGVETGPFLCARRRKLEQVGRRQTLFRRDFLVFLSGPPFFSRVLPNCSERVARFWGTWGDSGVCRKETPGSLSHLSMSEIDVWPLAGGLALVAPTSSFLADGLEMGTLPTAGIIVG